MRVGASMSPRRNRPAGELSQPTMNISTFTVPNRRPRVDTTCDAPVTVCDMRVGIVAVPGSFDSGITALLDIFRTAERVRPSVDRSIAPVEVVTIGSAREVGTVGGLRLAMDHIVGDDAALAALDVLVVPGIGVTTRTALAEALGTRDVRRLRAWLAPLAGSGDVRLAAACTGTFVLAESGLLDDRAATTTWW